MPRETFEIVDLGVDHSDYFPGFGVCFTAFDHCTYGIGDTAEEAYQDALDSMCQQGEHAQAVADTMPEHCPFLGAVEELENAQLLTEGDDADGPYYRVGIRWNTQQGENENGD